MWRGECRASELEYQMTERLKRGIRSGGSRPFQGVLGLVVESILLLREVRFGIGETGVQMSARLGKSYQYLYGRNDPLMVIRQ